MAQYEVMFSIYRTNEPGKAAIGTSSLTNLKTIVEAINGSQAGAIVEAQFGGRAHCSVYATRALQ